MRLTHLIDLVSESNIAIDTLSDYEVVSTSFWKRSFFIGPLKRINIAERYDWNGKVVRRDNQVYEMKFDSEDNELTLICKYLGTDQQGERSGLNFKKFYDQLIEDNRLNPNYDVVSSYWIEVEIDKKKPMRFDIPIIGLTFDYKAKKVMLVEAK